MSISASEIKGCCDEFAERTQRKAWEAGAFLWDGEEWYIVADGGSTAVYPMKFCPCCGTKVWRAS